MKRPLIAYGAWLAFVAACAFVATAWYRHVEAITWREVSKRLQDTRIDNGEQG